MKLKYLCRFPLFCSLLLISCSSHDFDRSVEEMMYYAFQDATPPPRTLNIQQQEGDIPCHPYMPIRLSYMWRYRMESAAGVSAQMTRSVVEDIGKDRYVLMDHTFILSADPSNPSAFIPSPNWLDIPFNTEFVLRCTSDAVFIEEMRFPLGGVLLKGEGPYLPHPLRSGDMWEYRLTDKNNENVFRCRAQQVNAKTFIVDCSRKPHETDSTAFLPKQYQLLLKQGVGIEAMTILGIDEEAYSQLKYVLERAYLSPEERR